MRTNPFAQFDYAYDLIARSPSAQRRLRSAWSADPNLAALTLPEVTKILRTPGHLAQDATIGALITLAQNGVPDATTVIINGILPALIASCSKRRLISRDGLIDELGYAAVITIGAFDLDGGSRLHMSLVSRITSRVVRVLNLPDAEPVLLPDPVVTVFDRSDAVEHGLVVGEIAPIAIAAIGAVSWEMLRLRLAYGIPIAALPNPRCRSAAHLRADCHRHLVKVRRALLAA